MLDWLLSTGWKWLLGIVGGSVLIWMLSALDERKRKKKYKKLIRDYYRKYGNIALEDNDLQTEIENITTHSIRLYSITQQQIRFDLNAVRNEMSGRKLKSKGLRGIWYTLKEPLVIHPINQSIEISQIIISGNTVCYINRDDKGVHKVIRFDIANYRAEDISDEDIDWKNCELSKTQFKRIENTLFFELLRTIKTCYDMWSCALPQNKIHGECNRHTSKMNQYLKPHGIQTELSENSWIFSHSGTSITLEEVIRELPDGVLFERPKADTPIQKSTPLKKNENISIDVMDNKTECETTIQKEQYFQQLRQLYRTYGSSAFQRLNEIQKQTQYPRYVIKQDLKKIREEEYSLQLEELCVKYGKSAKNHTKELERHTGYTREKIVADLKQPHLKSKCINTTMEHFSNTPSEERILTYIKALPIQFEFGKSFEGIDKQLKELSTAIVSSESVLGICNQETIAGLEQNLQTKRTRNHLSDEHEKNMEDNLLFQLFNYSYMMNIFKALERMDIAPSNINFEKLLTMIQNDCKARIQKENTRSNPVVHNMLQKYSSDSAKIKLQTITDVDSREYDFILTSLMSIMLTLTINAVFMNGGKIYTSSFKAYPSKKVMSAIDVLIVTMASTCLTTYANPVTVSQKQPMPSEEQATDNVNPIPVQQAIAESSNTTASAQSKSPFDYIQNMSRTDLIDAVNSEYMRIKGNSGLTPAMGEFGSFEFAGALLLWRFCRQHNDSQWTCD